MKKWWKLVALVTLFVVPMILGGCLNLSGSKPQACISVDVISGEAPLVAQFTGSSDQEVDSFQWTFGDGTSGYGDLVTHTYQSVGDYSVTLVVSKTNFCGTSMSEPAKITIRVLPVKLPMVRLIHVSPLPACQNQPVNFSADIVNGPVVEWSWRTSDGQTSTSSSPVFIFSNIGEKTIWLKVSDAKGHWSDEAQTVFNVQNCCQVCPPQPPCPSCGYLEGLSPERACVSVYKTFTIQVMFNNWPCGEYNTCDRSSPQSIVVAPAPDLGCDYCQANITWDFFYRGEKAVIGEDYQVVWLDGQFNQLIMVKFFKAREWDVKATLVSSAGTEVVWGHYVAKI